jgi:hypothetical protein
MQTRNLGTTRDAGSPTTSVTFMFNSVVFRRSSTSPGVALIPSAG